MAVAITYSFIDSKGKTATTEINVPAGLAIATYVAAAQGIAALVDALITGKITRIGVIVAVDLPGGLRTSPVAGSDVEEGGKFIFDTVAGFLTSLRLPTFNETLVSPTSRAIDTTDADVAAFIALMEDGATYNAVTVAPVDKHNDSVGSLRSAKESFQSSRAE